VPACGIEGAPTGVIPDMTVSVLVPAFNEAAVLPRTLAVLREAMRVFEANGWATELVVCDNNSTDDTAAIATAAGARVVFEPVNQIARARNRAASVAQGDWFVFVDADSEPSPALFADVAATIASGRVAAGGATVTMDDRRLWARAGVAAWNTISRTKRWAAGSFIFVDAAVFRAVGGFSQALYASEEIDLSRRLKRQARPTGRRLAILHRHPLHTSARKLRLYSWWEITRFMVRTVVTGGRTLTRADDCFVWYDGRR
jgi:glycosyltransferase involved in cell wall biosynthesis